VEWCGCSTSMMSGFGGMVQRSLDDRRALMDSCRAGAPFGAIVALIDGWSGGGLRFGLSPWRWVHEKRWR
jgi:hypothetical protein